MHTHEFCVGIQLRLLVPDTETGVDNNPDPSLLVPETCTKISVKSEQDEDGS